MCFRSCRQRAEMPSINMVILNRSACHSEEVAAVTDEESRHGSISRARFLPVASLRVGMTIFSMFLKPAGKQRWTKRTLAIPAALVLTFCLSGDFAVAQGRPGRGWPGGQGPRHGRGMGP